MEITKGGGEISNSFLKFSVSFEDDHLLKTVVYIIFKCNHYNTRNVK